MTPEGSVFCWTVYYGPRKWKSFHNRREARRFLKEQGGVLYKLVRAH